VGKTRSRGSHLHITCRSVCDWDQESWSVKIVLDCLIIPSWSLDFMEVQRIKRCHTPLVSDRRCWSVEISDPEFVLIPWSATKWNIDPWIPFDSGHNCFYRWCTCDYPLRYLITFLCLAWVLHGKLAGVLTA